MPTAVILTALPFEYQAVREHLRNVREEVHPEGTVYEVGDFEAWRVALAETGYGNSEIETRRALSYFSPQVVLLVGVANGVRDVEPGDVVVATHVHSLVPFGFNKKVEVRRVSQASHRIIQRARSVARTRRWLEHLSLTGNSEPKVVVAPIFSAGRIILGAELPDAFLSEYDDVVAVEMEGCGLLHVTSETPRVDAGVIRGIAGVASESTPDASILAAHHAAAFALDLIDQLPAYTLKPRETAQRKLYLKRIKIQSARCFKELDIDFTVDGKSRMNTQLIGQNGSGKTSFLRMVALGLCQQKETGALLGMLAGDFIHQGERGVATEEALIELELLDPADPEKVYLTRTVITSDTSGQELLHKEVEPDDFPWPDIFVCGYGVNRGTGPGRPLPQEYSRLDGLTSLFDDDTGLMDAESALRAFKLETYEGNGEGGGGLFTKAEHHLRSILGLEDPAYQFDVTSRHVTVSGPWGTMPFHALGDGYRGTAAWLMDLWGRAYLAGSLANGGTPAGIVLIDEIDEHLHPSWQKKLITTLKKKFPAVQFVSTTHSAMSIVNCGHDELFVCELQDGIAQVHQLSGPEGHTADRILRGEWFGLSSTLDDESEKLLHRYQEAVRNQAPEDEIAQLRDQLHDRLGVPFDSPIDELALEIAAEYRRQLRSETSAAERRRLIADGAQRLRQRLQEKKDAKG